MCAAKIASWIVFALIKTALWQRGRSLSLEAAVDVVGELQHVRKIVPTPLRMVG